MDSVSFSFLDTLRAGDVGAHVINHSDVSESWNQSESQNEAEDVTVQTWSGCNDSIKHEADFKKYDLNTRKPLLPPCVVCGVTSSGFHYGANTCEACKV